MAASRDTLAFEELIETKLRVPQVRHQVLSRTTLIDDLATPAGNGVLLSAIAPAGSGKSTLLVELFASLEQSGFTCCWLSLDPDDDEPAVFAKYFIAALYHFDPKAAANDLAFIKANPARELSGFFDSLLARLSRTNRKLAILVDDFHHLSHPVLLRFWNKLISHPAPTLRIAVASRARLPLDIGRHRIAGTLREIGHAELNFSASEIGSFMRDLHAIDLRASDIDKLHETTEGWAAGIQLAALAIIRSGGDAHELIDSFSGRNKDLTEYLFQTVLRVLSDDVRRFLLRTSPLTRLSPGLCNAVYESARGAELLDKVERSNLFLIPLDQEGRWFRYHHLFSEFLQAELRRESDDEFIEVCGLAAAWNKNQDRLTEAVQYCLSGKLYEQAANLIAEKAPDIAQYQGDHYTIVDWMRRLPEEYHSKRPEIILNNAWSRAFSRDLEGAIELADHVLEQLPQSRWSLTELEKNQTHWLAEVIKAIASVCADRLLDTVEQCEAIQAKLPESEPFLMTAILNATSYCHHARRELKQCVESSSRSYRYGRRAGSVYAMVWADFLHSAGLAELGRIRNANEIADRAIRTAGPQQRSNRYVFAMAAIAKAEVLTQQCDFHAASNCLAVSQEFASIFGPRIPLWTGLKNEARTLAWLGELDEAISVLRRGQDTALATEQPMLYFSLITEEIDLLIRHSQNAEHIQERAQHSGFSNTSQFIQISEDIRPLVGEMRKFTEAKLLMADGQHDEAIRKLGLLLGGVENDNRRSVIASLRALRSVALWRTGRATEARRELDRVITAAAPEKHGYPIVAAGADVKEILLSLKQGRPEAINLVDEEHKQKYQFEDRLIELLQGDPRAEPTQANDAIEKADYIEELTERESEILNLVSSGFSNQQIADDLLISLPTVKWHLHNVYEKFGVRNRTAATTFARLHNIL